MTQRRDTHSGTIPIDEPIKPDDMTNDIKDSDTDSDFDAYWQGDSAVSALYQSEADTVPPAHVDSAILFAARHQAQTLSERDRTWQGMVSRQLSKWFGNGMLVPAATACGVVGVASAMFMLQPSGSVPTEPIAAGTSHAANGSGPIFNTPEQYVSHILSLRERGKLDEADEVAQELQRIYPNQTVPGSNPTRTDD